MTNYRIGLHRTTLDRIGPQRITSDQIKLNCPETSATATYRLYTSSKARTGA